VLWLSLFLTFTIRVSFGEERNQKDKLLFDGKTLAGWEITDFKGKSAVYVSDSCIVLERGATITGIRWCQEFPKINYEVQLEAKRVAGADFFCGMTFPVNENYLTLIVGGWGGTIVGLSCIDGLDASESETGIKKIF